MKDIEGIEKALAVLQPLWQEIEADFNRHNEHFLKLLAVDHEPVGRILRAHLVSENFLDNFLIHHWQMAYRRQAQARPLPAVGFDLLPLVAG
jgi:hypothetical protein